MTNFMNDTNGWIPISDLSRAPVLVDDYDWQAVLVSDGRRVSGGRVEYENSDPADGLKWFATDDFCDEILYWMPPPPLPSITRDVLLRHVQWCLQYHECPLVTQGAECASYRWHGGRQCEKFAFGFPRILDETIKGVDK